MSVRWLASLGVLFLASAANAEGQAPSEAEKKAEEAVRSTLNKSGKSIDGCTARYLSEQPAAKGQARVDVKVKKDGWASEPKVQTSLPQARTLRLCLEAVAKSWRFPPPRQATPLGVTIPVEKGATFRIPSPGEEKKAPAQKEEKPKGFLKLLPGSFLPPYQEGGSSP